MCRCPHCSAASRGLFFLAPLPLTWTMQPMWGHTALYACCLPCGSQYTATCAAGAHAGDAGLAVEGSLMVPPLGNQAAADIPI